MGCPSSLPLQQDIPDGAGELQEVLSEMTMESQDVALELSSNCPPAPPYGLEVGHHVEPLVFLDASGEPRSLHDFCGQKLTLVYHYYGW